MGGTKLNMMTKFRWKLYDIVAGSVITKRLKNWKHHKEQLDDHKQKKYGYRENDTKSGVTPGKSRLYITG